MGFFGSLIKAGVGAIGGAIRGFTGAAAPVAAATVRAPLSIASRAATLGRRALPIVGAGALFGAADLATQAALGAGGGEISAMGGGNGRLRTVTTVITFDDEGTVVRRRVLKGSPHLMNRDLVTAKRVLRVAGKLGRKFSRKVREPSQTKMLLSVIQQKAIEKALTPDCPPQLALAAKC